MKSGKLPPAGNLKEHIFRRVIQTGNLGATPWPGLADVNTLYCASSSPPPPPLSYSLCLSLSFLVSGYVRGVCTGT